MLGRSGDTTIMTLKDSLKRQGRLFGIVNGILCLAIIIFSHSRSQASPAVPVSWVPPDNIELEIYELTVSGANTGVLCSSDNYNAKNYGCTAFCNNQPNPYCPPVGDPARGSRAYPYPNSVVTIPFEHDYTIFAL